ncbi:hypothetical protein [Agromyces sp. CCNWLW203]
MSAEQRSPVGLDLRHVFDDRAALDADTWQDAEEARRIAKELP